MISPNIFDYIKTEETNFNQEEIQLGDNWYWNMRKHVQMIFHLKNGVFYTGDNEWLRAFKNIMEPILNVASWTEDIEVKDVTFFIENENGKELSFLVKKYHDEVYTREHDLDALFDDITESDIDYGGVVVQKGFDIPEVINLLSIAFCDQTDITGGPIGIKFSFSPSKLLSMKEYGWGDEKNGADISLSELITIAEAEKASASDNQNKNKTTGKNIEVYIVRGDLPSHYLNGDNDMETYINQIQIVAYYTNKDSKQVGVTIYKKEEVLNDEDESNVKFFTSKKVYQRGLGRGYGETLLSPQIWTNFLTIHKTNLLESASKVPLYTDDPSYSDKNKIQDMENLEITTIEENKKIYQVPTASPTNIQLYTNEINEWWAFAQTAGSANDPIMGKEGASGTTFRGQERTVAQGKGLHDKRRGQRAKFIEELYRDYIIPDITKEILKGKKFLANLSIEELRWVADKVAVNESNKKIRELILNGKLVTREEQQGMIEFFKTEYVKKGNKKLIEILKGEFEDIEIKIGINVANKQKDLANLSDKLLSIFQFIFTNPQAFQNAMQIPALANSFENILEFGGMSIGDFSTLLQPPTAGTAIPSPVDINASAPTIQTNPTAQ